jgi:hypothetical protein
MARSVLSCLPFLCALPAVWLTRSTAHAEEPSSPQR